jgi:hypothetical protein
MTPEEAEVLLILPFIGKQGDPMRPQPRHHRRQASKNRSYLAVEQLETRNLMSLSGIAHPLLLVHPHDIGGPFGSGYIPIDLQTAYGFNQISNIGSYITNAGRGQTIAIVDAEDDPTIQSDIALFSQTYGLPQMDGIAGDPWLRVVNQNGGPQLPFPSFDGWDLEISLDVEWAHAIAPAANILLVEANSPFGNDLYAGVATAANWPGVHVVSMSWGQEEISMYPSTEASLNQLFVPPSVPRGITFVAASGDDGGIDGPGFPAVSPYVLAVGGTSLNINPTTHAYQSESGWTGSNGGISFNEFEPSYQFTAQQFGARTVPDVAYNADPNTGFAVLDNWFAEINGLSDPWQEVGGTSAGSPQWAAYIAIVDQLRAQRGLPSLDGYKDLLPALYDKVYGTSPYSLETNLGRTNLYAQDFHQVLLGANSYFSAGPGYNLVTGIGTPIAQNLAVTLSTLLPGTSAGGTFGGTFTTTTTTTTTSTTTMPHVSLHPSTVLESNDLAAGGFIITATPPLAASAGTMTPFISFGPNQGNTTVVALRNSMPSQGVVSDAGFAAGQDNVLDPQATPTGFDGSQDKMPSRPESNPAQPAIHDRGHDDTSPSVPLQDDGSLPALLPIHDAFFARFEQTDSRPPFVVAVPAEPPVNPMSALGLAILLGYWSQAGFATHPTERGNRRKSGLGGS